MLCCNATINPTLVGSRFHAKDRGNFLQIENLVSSCSFRAEHVMVQGRYLALVPTLSRVSNHYPRAGKHQCYAGMHAARRVFTSTQEVSETNARPPSFPPYRTVGQERRRREPFNSSMSFLGQARRHCRTKLLLNMRDSARTATNGPGLSICHKKRTGRRLICIR